MRARPVYPCVLNQIAFPRSGILPVSTRVSILSRSFTSRCTPEAGQFDKVRRNYREKVEGKQCAPLQLIYLSFFAVTWGLGEFAKLRALGESVIENLPQTAFEDVWTSKGRRSQAFPTL